MHPEWHNWKIITYYKQNTQIQITNLKFSYGCLSFGLLQIFPCWDFSFISSGPVQSAWKTCSKCDSFSFSVISKSPQLCRHYFERLFTVSDASQAEERGSTSFNFHSSTSSDPLTGLRALYFLDHRVTVTRSSIWTSLTSGFVELKLCISTIGRMEGVDWEKEDLLGEEWQLPSGLIWVAISLLETARHTSVAASFTRSTLSPAFNHIRRQWLRNNCYSFVTTKKLKGTLQLRI